VFKHPEEKDFLRIYKFVKNCKPLENYSEHFYKIMIRYFGDSCIVAEFKNELIGFILGFRSQVDKKKLFLWQIGVFSKYREQEIGKRMIDKFENLAEKKECKIIELTVDPENKPSFRFFEKNGYKNVSFKEGKTININGKKASKDYYKPGRHFILYQKKL
jgi:diaminobutyrate acetyltransferase